MNASDNRCRLIAAPGERFKAIREEILSGWDNPACRKRAMFGPQRETDAIFLRYTPHSSHAPQLTKKGPSDTYYSLHGYEVIDAEEVCLFPEAIRWLRETADRLLGHLQRAVILGLWPGSYVYKHIDLGSHYVCRDRYHLVVQSELSPAYVDGHWYEWRQGEVWWLNNKLSHGAHNPGKTSRIHLQFDVLPYSRVSEARALADAHCFEEHGTDPFKNYRDLEPNDRELTWTPTASS